MRRFLVILFSFSLGTLTYGQTELFKKDKNYSRQDSLRGSITPEREWWDLQHYDLFVAVDIEKRSISGKNIVRYKVLQPMTVMQIDLQSPMRISKVTQDGKVLDVVDDGNAHFVQLRKKQKRGKTEELHIEFEGIPLEAARAPWDGGFSWKEDSNGKPFVATSNQGIGASLWWPCKDHAYDEPNDGQILRINVSGELIAVGNGRLTNTEEVGNGTKTFVWKVVNPINNYGVNINIGDYVNFSETFKGENGELDLDYWVLKENEDKAREQFKDAPRTIEAFEHWFGPYPFYEDSYKLVEVPYLGMEHQSSVTYGNKFANGYLGTDLSGSGWGLKWDFIIVHESGHEWFANNITYIDAADMWIHEGFTSYSESLYTEYHFGKNAGAEYTRGLRSRIANNKPVIGDYDVNREGSGDMYYKGHNLLHTLRQIVNDDEKWRNVLRGLNKDFYHQTVSSKQVEEYISRGVDLDFQSIFDQYLRDNRLPTLEYKIEGEDILYRWADVIDSFNMPVDALVDGKEVRLKPTTAWKEFSGKTLELDVDYYVSIRKL